MAQAATGGSARSNRIPSWPWPSFRKSGSRETSTQTTQANYVCMKRYLLDTNVISEVRKPKPHGAVLLWLRELRAEQAFLSAVTMGELQLGIELTRRQDPLKAKEIEAWVDQLENSYPI